VKVPFQEMAEYKGPNPIRNSFFHGVESESLPLGFGLFE
jgi:hypothetical protein